MALQEAVEASGETPLDVLLGIMRWANREADELIQACHKALEEGDADAKLKAYFEDGKHMKVLALDAATRAAPYVHSRLASSEKPAESTTAECNAPKAPEPHRLAELAARFSRHGLRAIEGGKYTMGKGRTRRGRGNKVVETVTSGA